MGAGPSVLLCIDMQRAFDGPSWPARNNADLDRNGLALLAAWRRRGWPILHVRHDSVEAGSALRPGLEGNHFRDGFEPAPGEAMIVKTVNSAFIGTDLDLRRRRLEAAQVVAFGLTTDHCVSTTVRMGANLGWRMVVVGDACATFAREIDGETLSADHMHKAHLAALKGEFADLATTAAITEG